MEETHTHAPIDKHTYTGRKYTHLPGEIHTQSHTYTHKHTIKEIHSFTSGNTHTVTQLRTHTGTNTWKLAKLLKWIGLFGHIVYFHCPWEEAN